MAEYTRYHQMQKKTRRRKMWSKLSNAVWGVGMAIGVVILVILCMKGCSVWLGYMKQTV